MCVCREGQEAGPHWSHTKNITAVHKVEYEFFCDAQNARESTGWRYAYDLNQGQEV